MKKKTKRFICSNNNSALILCFEKQCHTIMVPVDGIIKEDIFPIKLLEKELKMLNIYLFLF